MGSGVIALFTPDSRYANAFMEYNFHHEKGKVVVKSYTNPESLEYALKNEDFDLLLIDAELIDEPGIDYKGTRVILSHKKYISDTSVPAIFLYQKAEYVFRQIYELLSEESVEEEFSCAATSSMPEFFGVYSPCYPLEREQFAIELAKIIGKKKRTLYLNMAALTEGDEGNEDGISELLLFLQAADKSIVYKLPALIRHKENYDYLPGVKHYQDIYDIQVSDIERLMKQFERIDSYDVVIVDIGLSGELAYCMLRYCSKIWMPVNANCGYGRQEHLKHDISLEKKESIWQYIDEIPIPEGWYRRKEIREKWMRTLVS